MPYEAKLPDGVSLPTGFRINTDDLRYKALVDLATREKWAQSSFSGALHLEFRRVTAAQQSAKPAPAAAPSPAPAPAVPENWGKMSNFQKMAHAVAASDAKRAAGGKP
jgi:hypothetical protein